MAVNEVLDFFEIANAAGKKIASSDTIEAVKTSAQLFKKAKAISASANKYVVKYPVLVSSKIADIRSALAITKQIELECAKFIILAAGLKPIIGGNGNEITAQLNNIFTGESFKGMNLSIEPASDDEFYSAENYLNSIKNTVYQSFKKTSSFVKSVEMTDVDTFNEESEQEPVEVNSTVITDNAIVQSPTERKPNRFEKDKFDDYFGEDINKTVLNKLSKEGPTVIRLKLLFANPNGDTTPITIPLAVKATLTYIDDYDCKEIISGSKTFSSKFMTLVKVISGELCFKEWLFQFEKAKQDVELEHKLGRTPFWRRLLSGKNKWKIKNTSQVLQKVLDKQTKFIKGMDKDDMPMCTIIFDYEDINESASMRFERFLKDRRYADALLDEYMLLGMGIVDSTNNILYLFFAGEDGYRTIDITKAGLSGGGNSSSSDTASLIKLLDKSYTMMNRR